MEGEGDFPTPRRHSPLLLLPQFWLAHNLPILSARGFLLPSRKRIQPPFRAMSNSPNPREVFLQNRLAVSATLLYQAARVLSGKEKCDLPILLLEIESFFGETKRLLIAEIDQEAKREVTPISAPPAAKSGERWRQEGFNGWQSPFPVPPPTPITGELSPAPSSPPLSGGTPQMGELWRISFAARIKLSLNTKPSGMQNGS